MNFFLGFADELVKIAIDWPSKKDMAIAAAGPAMAREHGKAMVDRAAEKAAPYKNDIAGAVVGGLAGKALLKRTALGALLGLGAVHHKDIAEAGKKVIEKAKGEIKLSADISRSDVSRKYLSLKNIAGAGIGGLAGHALMGRPILGMLAGLGIANLPSKAFGSMRNIKNPLEGEGR